LSLDTVLRKMGFTSTTFSETILTVEHVGERYTMPFGVLYKRGFLWGRVFQSSKMYEVLRRKPRYATLSVTQNPILFYKAVFEKERIKYREFTVNGVRMLCVAGCSACVFTEITRVVFRGDYAAVWLKPIGVRVLDKYPKTLNRASYAIVEALVHYTKIPFTSREEACKHYQHILLCRDTVYRSSRSRVYRRVADFILKLLEGGLGFCREKS